MANRVLLIRAFVESARQSAEQTGKPLTTVLADIRNAIFNGEVQDGKVLVGSAEAGGTSSFMIPPGHAPLEIMELAQEALDWCGQFADPDNPPKASRRIRRLRISFAKAATQ